MKFQPDTPSGTNVITRQESARIWVGGNAFEGSLLVPWQGPVLPWDVPRFEALTEAHFARIAELSPEVVIFGSGQRLAFLSPSLYRSLIERGVGVETMDTAAACRTFNVLVNEGRHVVGAFLLEAG